MTDYDWVLDNGVTQVQQVGQDYYSLNKNDIENILKDTFSRYGHTLVMTELEAAIYHVMVTDALSKSKEIIVCVKNITPGGRNPQEFRIQQNNSIWKRAHIIAQHQGFQGVLLGIYNTVDTTDPIIAAWKLEPNLNAKEASTSKQISNRVLSNALINGFNQSKSRREYICAFRQEFIYFYLENADWIHDYLIEDIAQNSLSDAELEDEFIGVNKIYYGAPGTGKSNKVDNRYPSYSRITFHPEINYFDFVGGLRPVSDETKQSVYYDFVPGVFTEVLIDALENPQKEFGIIIEEINRANTAAVFGDIFQLLDRDYQGKSRYTIKNKDLLNYINQSTELDLTDLYIPSNLSIIATMNSADQGVNVLDSAFKRRWYFEYVPINFDEDTLTDKIIAGFDVPWKTFGKLLNNHLITELEIEEDKLIGQWFIHGDDLNDIDSVASKLLIYLWDDVARYDREKLFSVHSTFSELIKKFKENGVFCFVPKLAEEMKKYDASSSDDEINEGITDDDTSVSDEDGPDIEDLTSESEDND